MKRTIILVLLVGMSVAWSMPARAQGTGAAEYGRQTQIEWQKYQKMAGKSGKKQRKAMKEKRQGPTESRQAGR